MRILRGKQVMEHYGNEDKMPEIGDWIKAQNDPNGRIFEIDGILRNGRTIHLKGFPEDEFVSLYRINFVCTGKVKENILNF